MATMIREIRGESYEFEYFIYVNDVEVSMLFDERESETFDPTEAVEYLDDDDQVIPLQIEDEVKVVFNPMQGDE